MLAMKGAMIEDEVKSLRESRILGLCGGEKVDFQSWQLVSHGESEMRGVISVKKAKKTDPKYPRQYATILKKPI